VYGLLALDWSPNRPRAAPFAPAGAWSVSRPSLGLCASICSTNIRSFFIMYQSTSRGLILFIRLRNFPNPPA